jgi:hypothetical protein
VPCAIVLAVLAAHHSHLGERSWAARGAPETTVLVEGELIQHEWSIHLAPALWANGEPLPGETSTAQIYRFFPPYLHALAWALTGSVVKGLVLVTDVFWAGAALATAALAGMATRSRVGQALAGLLVVTAPGFLALLWHTPHLGAYCLVPTFWLVVERTSPYRPGAPWRYAALVGVLLGLGGLTYDLHLPLAAWLLLVEGPPLLAGPPGTRPAGLARFALTSLCFGAVYSSWFWLSQHVLVGSIGGLNESGPALRDSLAQLRDVGPRAFVSERTFRLLALLGKAFTWPIVGMAFLGVFGLPRRWAWRSGLLVAVFAAGAVVTKGEARVVFNGLSGVCVLAAGGVLWTGRWGGRLLGERHDERLRAALAAGLLAASFVATYGELWGDYSVLRAW